MVYWLLFGASITMIVVKNNPQFIGVGQGFWAMFGVLLGIIIDKKIEKENRQIPVGLDDNN